MGARRAPEDELEQTLGALVERANEGDGDLGPEFAAFVERYGAGVYSTLIHHLCHLRVPPEEARLHWQRIVEHWGTMRERMQAPVDLRVALLDYFLSVNRKFDNPTIVEMRLFEQACESSYRDALTGIHNYRFFREHIAREIARCERRELPLSLAMVDVDDFKLYNDRNGHEAGNAALAQSARLMAGSLRGEDIVARYGGEEFALVFSGIAKAEAGKVAERICSTIAGHRFPGGRRQPGGRLSVSIGVATLPADAATAADLIRQADTAMYMAKADGKNRVRLFGDSTRSHRRIDAALEGSFRVLGREEHPLATVTVSRGGMLFLSERRPPEDATIEINLDGVSSERVCPMLGRVLYAKQREDGKFESAVSLDDCGAAGRRAFTRLVRESEKRTA